MNSRGVVMVQVVVLGVLMALVASYLMQWAFGRYQLVARHQNSTAAAGDAEGCMAEFMSLHHAQLSQGNAITNWTCNRNGWSMTVNVVNRGTTAAPRYEITMSRPFTTN